MKVGAIPELMASGALRKLAEQAEEQSRSNEAIFHGLCISSSKFLHGLSSCFSFPSVDFDSGYIS